jgi:excinuclease ABC subunit A
MNNIKKENKTVISVTGAREHNLKNINVEIPKNALTVITGPSGSGKSSLALDILYTEGKRRYMESLSSYARQFLGIAKKPEVDKIEGLCPAIAIDQKTVGSNPRSTVGTITEIYDYLRVLFARIGTPTCPQCKTAITAEAPDQIIDRLLASFNKQTITITAPVVVQRKGEFQQQLIEWYEKGYYRFVIDGTMHRFADQDEIRALKLAKTYKHSIDIILDRVEVDVIERSRLFENIERAFALAHGMCKVIVGPHEYLYSSLQACLTCGQAFPELEPRLFSFNSPIGACSQCHGLGIETTSSWSTVNWRDWKESNSEWFESIDREDACSACHGQRLNPHGLAVHIGTKNIYEIASLSLQEARAYLRDEVQLTPVQQEIGATLLKEIDNRLGFLINVGLGYLSLSRTARTLSGGEGQRIRLATQIGSALTGVLYILDEPSIGLHQRDNDRLLETLKQLRDQGNTVVVVEHDTDTIKQADHVIDMGPGAGVLGGRITATGTAHELAQNTASLTGAYLAGKMFIPLKKEIRAPRGKIILKNCTKNNLKGVRLEIPLGTLCCVSGVSGSGKSTLVLDELVPAMDRYLHKKAVIGAEGAQQPRLIGADSIENMVVIDQSPIGRTPRSNPATYLGIFNDIRTLFAQLPESQARGYAVGRFSFNVPEGRCMTCQGEGTITIAMQFLADVVMTCKTCKGKRYNAQTLEITYKGKNIAQILEMSAHEAVTFFAAHKSIAKRLQLLCDVGLDYLALGQPSTTLSGGEAQRIKLVNELAKRGSNTLYILDEPTTGLHTHDIAKLLLVLNKLIDKGNSMVVIEHNLDVLKTADHIIDLGPEGGNLGGTIVAQGTVQEVANTSASHTGKYLKQYLQ